MNTTGTLESTFLEKARKAREARKQAMEARKQAMDVKVNTLGSEEKEGSAIPTQTTGPRTTTLFHPSNPNNSVTSRSLGLGIGVGSQFPNQVRRMRSLGGRRTRRRVARRHMKRTKRKTRTKKSKRSRSRRHAPRRR